MADVIHHINLNCLEKKMKSQHPLYLSSLVLNNFATFETQSIQFDPSFNAIIGETGSGKSLIVDALQLLFGQRADKKLIRKGSDFATVEAVFHSSESTIVNYFDNIGFPIVSNETECYEITIKRIVYRNGNSKTFLNYQNCNLQMLQNFAKRFIDLVGQFDNQKLMSPNYQLTLLDNYIAKDLLFENYQEAYLQLEQTKNSLLQLKEKQAQGGQRSDYLQFQINEIEKLNPSIDDENHLMEQKTDLTDANQKSEVLTKISASLDENSNSVISQLNSVASIIEKNQIFFQNKDYSAKIMEAISTIEDVSFNCSKSHSALLDATNNESSFEEIIDRLDLYQKLKRKFGPTTQDLTTSLQLFKQELLGFESLNSEIQTLENSYKDNLSHTLVLAEKIHGLRISHAQELSEKLTKTIQKLKMRGASLRMDITKLPELNRTGLSSIRFMVESNPGEGFYKLGDVASGGELSRILLAIRQMLASNDTISVFLFDEIDAGVGGETALSVGQALRSVSTNSQVVAITHLPQIANYAKKLIVVSKETANERTFSMIKEIQGNGKDAEIRAMMPLN